MNSFGKDNQSNKFDNLQNLQDKLLRHQTPLEEQTPPRPKTEKEWRSYVDEQINQAMKSGKFDNLPGQGKPLNLKANPHADPADELAYKLLKDNGYTPEWIERDKEIRQKVETARKQLRTAWQHHHAGLHGEQTWQKAIARFEVSLTEINRKIDDFNLIVPILSKQKSRLRLITEIENITESRKGT